MFWLIIITKLKLKVGEAPTYHLYKSGVLLTNFYKCLYPNHVSRCFNCMPLLIEQNLEIQITESHSGLPRE